MLDKNEASARIDQGINLPDYFSCRNCNGWQWSSVCDKLRQERLCAKQMLFFALKTDKVQIHLMLSERIGQ